MERINFLFGKLNKFGIFLFLAAMAVGALYLAPQVLIKHNLEAQGKTYLFLQFGDEINFYMARAREVYDGHFPPSDLAFDSKPTVYNPLPPLIFASFIYLFGGNIQNAYFAIIFIFSGTIFLLFYLVGRKILENRIWATCLAFVAVLTTLARNLPWSFFSLDNFLNVFLKNFFPWVKTPMDRLPLLRFDDPLLTLPFYLTAIFFLYSFWEHPRKSSAIFAGISSGLLFYTYFHDWTYIVTVVGILFLLAAYYYRHELDRLKLFLPTWLIMGVMSVPYFVNLFLFKSLPESADVIARLGVVNDNIVDGWPYYIIYLLAALLVWRLFLQKDRQKALFFLAAIAGLFVLLGASLITGLSVAPYYWIRTANIVLFFIIGNSLMQWARSFGSQRIVAVVLIVATSLLVGKKIINASLFINPPPEISSYYVFNPAIIESWDWLNANLPKEPRIISPSYVTSNFLTSYTSARPYMPTADQALVTNYLLEERFLKANAVFQIPADFLRVRIAAEPLGSGWKKPGLLHDLNLRNFQGNLYTNFYADSGFKIPQSKTDELMSRYRYTNPDLRSIEADYIYYGPFERELSPPDFSNDQRLELVFKNSAVEIYRIKK